MKNKILGTLAILTGLTGIARAGVIEGPEMASAVLSGFGHHRYIFHFEANKIGTIRVTGKGSSNLDCSLTDGDGKVVMEDNRPVDGCYLTVLPQKSGPYHLVIDNRLKFDEAYQLITN